MQTAVEMPIILTRATTQVQETLTQEMPIQVTIQPEQAAMRIPVVDVKTMLTMHPTIPQKIPKISEQRIPTEIISEI